MARQPAAPRWPDLEAEIERLERDVEQLRDEMRRLADARAGDAIGHTGADDLDRARHRFPDRHADGAERHEAGTRHG